MAYDEKLADRIREALVNEPNVTEKRMFSGITFMVNDKMCISVAHDEMMCRIDPEIAGTELENSHTRPMVQNGRMMKGFIFVQPVALQDQRYFEHWISLSLDFNKRAKTSKKVKK